MTTSARSSLGMLTPHWDAVVVGAGPAGALVARQLALRQRRVLLVEKKRFPRAKVCGACLNARAVSALQAANLGDLPAQMECLPWNSFEILTEGRRVSVPLPEGVAVGRSELDAGLVAEAVASGATFYDGVAAKVGGLSADGSKRQVNLLSKSETRSLTASVVLAADGLQHSCLAQHQAFASDVSSDSLIGLGATIAAEAYPLPDAAVRMVAGRGGYVGIVRLSGDRLNVAAAVEPSALRKGTEPAALVASILDQARATPATLPSSHWHGTGPLTRATRSVTAERLFVLGDATGYVEPFTGEGIAWALCSALLVAPLAEDCLLERANPRGLAQRWHTLHQAEVLRRQRWCRRLAWTLRTSWRRRLAMAAAATMPWLARRVARAMNQPFVLPQ